MAEKKDDTQLQKVQKRVKTADRVRLASLFLSLLLVLFLFYCNKFAMEASWYQESRVAIYNVLFVVALVMLGATLVKLFFVAQYNCILKKR